MIFLTYSIKFSCILRFTILSHLVNTSKNGRYLDSIKSINFRSNCLNPCSESINNNILCKNDADVKYIDINLFHFYVSYLYPFA